MFGINSEIIGLLTNKNKLADKIKAEAPAVLDGLLQLIAHQCGAQEGQRTAVMFYKAKNADGQETTMARVHAIDAFDDLVFPALGTMDVPTALRQVPNEEITSKLPW